MASYDETLLSDGSVFWQEKQGFRFGQDVVLLADFIRDFAKEGEDNLEIGTGNGILPVLLQKRNFPSRSYLAMDILDSNLHLAKKNLELHQVEADLVCCDVKRWERKNCYAQIFVNPPYMKVDGKRQNESYEKAVARHELTLNLEDLFSVAKKLLRPIGQLYMVHRSHRLQEILALAENYAFSLSRIRFVYHRRGSACKLVLLEFYKGKQVRGEILEAQYIEEK